jgi:hypothetical protein
VDTPINELQEYIAISAQHLAKHLSESPINIDIPVINMSFGIDISPDPLDGSSTLTQFVDWSATAHETLYVVAGNEVDKFGVPADNFNGITVAMSSKASDGVFRKVHIDNDYGEDPSGAGTFTDILAPGFDLDLAGPDGSFAPEALDNGTSFAAPHVTGTVALLQQHALSRIPNTGWDDDSKRHQVMKAVLLNSADKIKDDGSIEPVGTFLGMQRTVEAQLSDNTWLDSTAFSDDATPLDREMGAGHLNAKRAFTQFDPGETPAGNFADASVNIPQIGWDFNATTFSEFNKYLIQGDLTGGTHISVTLVWDRIFGLSDDWDSDGEFDVADETNPADTFALVNFVDLDLHVVPAGTTDLETATWKASSTAAADVTSLEHIFEPIPMNGQYEIWIENHSTFGSSPYALAWWLTAPPAEDEPGDYNGNGSVGPEDYDLWSQQFGDTATGSDGNGDGVVDAADYVVWRKFSDAAGSGVGAVPEPAGVVMVVVTVACLGVGRGRRG